jgi:hypothetical protein
MLRGSGQKKVTIYRCQQREMGGSFLFLVRIVRTDANRQSGLTTLRAPAHEHLFAGFCDVAAFLAEKENYPGALQTLRHQLELVSVYAIRTAILKHGDSFCCRIIPECGGGAEF